MRLKDCFVDESLWTYRYATTYLLTWDACVFFAKVAFSRLDDVEVLISETDGAPFARVEANSEDDLFRIPESDAIRICGKHRNYDGAPFRFALRNRTDSFVVSADAAYMRKITDGMAEYGRMHVFDRFADSVEITAYARLEASRATDWVLGAIPEALGRKENFSERRTFGSVVGRRTLDLSETCEAVVRNYMEVMLERGANVGELSEASKVESSGGENDEADVGEYAERLNEFLGTLPKSPVFRVRFSDAPTDFRSSKLGGDFWWPDDNPPKLSFLCQVNFSELPENDVLPDSGLLQFFIRCDDEAEAYGLFDSDGYRVVFHEEVGDDGRRFESPETSEGCSPVVAEKRMEFVSGTELLSRSDFRFERFRERFSDLPDDVVYEDRSVCGDGSKVLGYPYFTQWDPRDDDDRRDVLLLQLDSDDGCTEWGDAGVANFFVSSEALKRRDFSDVLYNWDCY